MRYVFPKPMPEDIQSLFDKKIKPVNFERSISLFGATTIGVGALLGAGIYVLIGAAANVAGPSLILTYFVCGLLAFVTTLMFAELSRVIPRSGGGYTYTYNVLGSLGGFTTGWFLALGSIFASGLYAIGFAEYALSLSGKELPHTYIKILAIGITLLIGLLGLRAQGKQKFNLQNWIVWGNVAILLVLIVVSFFYLKVDNIEPFFPKGFTGTFVAISLIYISFFGYQLIANNADEIVEPEKTIPKAMKYSMLIAIAVYVLIAVAAVMTVSWNELANSSAPLVLLADKSFGGKGWVVISIGGILASLGALSSTIISQSRQTYAMGKDRFFPDVMGKLDEKTKQPKVALITAVVLVSLVLFFFDLEFIAKATNFCLLVSLLPVSLALRKLYKKNPALKPTARWKHYLPEVAFLINLGLLFTLDIVSLAFGQQLALVGALIYFLYSRKREKRGKEGLNIILEEEKRFSFYTQNKILVPVSNPQTQNALLMLSNTLLSKKGGEIIVLAIKNVPTDVDFYEALKESSETLDVIKRSIKLAKALKVKIKPIIRASHKVSSGIVNVAKEENSDLIIMGFPKILNEDKSGILNLVLKRTYNDMLVLHLKTDVENFSPKKIAIYLRETKHMQLKLMCATAIAERNKAKIVIVSFLPENFQKRQKNRADRIMLESLQNLETTAIYDLSLIVSNDPQAEIIRMSKDFDILIMGMDHGPKGKPIVESPAFQIAQHAQCSVILANSIGRLQRFVQRI